MGSDFFEDPHRREFCKQGTRVVCELTVAERLPQTSSAMDEVARAEAADERQRLASGMDNSTHSFEKLMHAFDTFVKEYYANVKGKPGMSPGKASVLRFIDDDQYSLRLFWQLRHSCTHTGSSIDSKAKSDYERIFQAGKIRGLKPVIDIPETLEVGKKIKIKLIDYSKIKQCMFRFLAKILPTKDVKTLETRSFVSEFDVTPRKTLWFPYKDFYLEIFQEDVVAAGWTVRRRK